MNKKGFTLIEVTISVTLLSIIMVFMLSFLNNIRSDEDLISERTKLILNKAEVSQIINKDVKDSLGIEEAYCVPTRCVLYFYNDDEKTLALTNDNTTVTYTNNKTNEIILSKKLPENHTYYLELKENSDLKIIKLGLTNAEEYDIEIVDYQINNQNEELVP